MTLLVLLLAPAAFGATVSTALTGRIMSGGKPVRGATVTATSHVLQAPRVSRTGSYGTYWLAALPPGVYEVTFSTKGMQTITRRATIELGRVARADAELEPSEDEETGTSTAKTVSVGDTTTITTHFSDWLLERLPYGGVPAQTALLSPGSDYYDVVLDDAIDVYRYTTFGEESIQELTMLRGAAPLEQELSAGTTLVMQTRSGGNDFSLSLRDTLTSASWVAGPLEGDVQQSVEATASGRIVRDRLWFFGGGWTNDDATIPADERGALVKLTSQLGASHNLIATWLRGERSFDLSFDIGEVDDSVLALHYVGAISPRLTIESTASRVHHGFDDFTPRDRRDDRNALVAKLTYVLPTSNSDHVLTAGASAANAIADLGFTDYDTNMIFVNDRWSYGRWLVEAGVRKQTTSGYDETLPRAVVVYDVLGDGHHAIQASYTRYSPLFSPPFTEYAAGYIAALGSSGAFRIDAVHTTVYSDERTRIDADATYRLFDRLELGGTASYFFLEEISSTVPMRQANAWLSVDIPVGSHVASVTVLQRYRGAGEFGRNDTVSDTDVALRYRLPVSKADLTLAADVTNVFNNSPFDQLFARALRLWVRVRL